jgi:hypothetical protein
MQMAHANNLCKCQQVHDLWRKRKEERNTQIGGIHHTSQRAVAMRQLTFQQRENSDNDPRDAKNADGEEIVLGLRLLARMSRDSP